MSANLNSCLYPGLLQELGSGCSGVLFYVLVFFFFKFLWWLMGGVLVYFVFESFCRTSETLVGMFRLTKLRKD